MHAARENSYVRDSTEAGMPKKKTAAKKKAAKKTAGAKPEQTKADFVRSQPADIPA